VRRLLAAFTVLLLSLSARAENPLMLFNGTSLLGWSPQGSWSAGGGIMSVSGNGNRHILTAVPFGDMTLQFEYNESALIGAKLHLWAAKNNNGGLVVDLDNSWATAGVGGIETLAHSSIASISEGWHKVIVEAQHGQIEIHIDAQSVTTASGLGSRAGYIGFEASGNGTLQVRNIKLTPHGMNELFNSSDLSGWKSIAHNPNAKGGMGYAFEKAFSLGIAGGSAKAHSAKWTVQNGAIHGEDGPGSLENGTAVEDAVIQLSASAKGTVKPENFISLLMRATPGQLGGGYAIGIGPYAGGIEPVAKRAPSHATNPVEETVVIAGRTIAIWIGPTLTTVYTDTRAEGSTTTQGAKTSAGAISILLPKGDDQVNLKHISMAPLPKVYGAPAKEPAPAQETAKVVAPAAAPAPSAAEAALLQQQQNVAKKDATDQANKAKSASLMRQALATSDPQQQMSLYSQIVQIDPTNAAAIQGYKEAQTKLEAQQNAQQQQKNQEMHQQLDAQTKEQQTTASLVEAQSDFLNGHISQASAALSIAERLSPSNPMVRDLRSRISSAAGLRSRLYWLGGGIGFVSLLGILTAWTHRRRQQRYAVLEITRGLDVGRTFPLDKDLIRIGAVPQDGGQKNDFVIQDVEHAISRFHCEVVRKNGQLYLTDLRSSNGTLLNGESLRPGNPALLRRGSRITLASSVDLKLGYQRRSKRDA